MLGSRISWPSVIIYWVTKPNKYRVSALKYARYSPKYKEWVVYDKEYN